MNWFQRLFQKKAKVAPVPQPQPEPEPIKPEPIKPELPNISEFKSAGVVFTDGNSILAGYQPNKKIPGITGIGGKREAEETYIQTALRECCEELFGCTYVPPSLINELMTTTEPSNTLYDGYYVNLIYTFKDLLKILDIAKKINLWSPLYTKIPTTLDDLILQRKYSEISEIQGLCILPLAYYSDKHPIIHNEFRRDIKELVLLLCPHKILPQINTIHKPQSRTELKVDGGGTRSFIA